jgi:hypothetical protein
MNTPFELALKVAAGVAVGLCIGLERQWAHKEVGVRTFAIAALLGTIAWLITPTLAFAIAITALLSWKTELITFISKLTVTEIRSTLLFAFITAVVYPLLPPQPLDPWHIVNLRSVWLTVMLVSGLQFFNYILLRQLGKRGIQYSALLGGLVNSAATALLLGEEAMIFTFFSFSPPLFEGENPWLDPRSVEAQRDLVALLARRYSQVELLSWDLINEPSFGDPKKIFALRPLPHYDRFEVAAFQRWLVEHHTLAELHLRWRQTPADMPDWEHILPPSEEDFDTSVRNTMVRASLKVADYTRFSQDMFNNWASKMVAAIQAGGGQTLVGVGQDEAGARIAPQFYSPVVDYTTTHPWWNIDDLLWDMLLDKTLNKPNLIQETGVMQLRDLDGRPWGSEQENACLLERKLVTGLIARGAGLIQWLWHTNSYMTSDNENSIGLLRADGSAKPELDVMEEFGRLVLALDGRVLEASSPPDVWVVIPYAQWFARPAPARYGTQQAVRVLGYDLGIIPQMVSEYQLDAGTIARHRPRTIIVPAAQLLDRHAWSVLLQYVHEGGTLLVSGVIARDAYNLPFAPGVDGIAEDLVPVPVSRYEDLKDTEGHISQITFADEKISYVKKAHNQINRYPHGAGVLVWCGLPVELANETSAIRAIYRQVIPQAAEVSHVSSPVLISQLVLSELRTWGA